MVSIVRMRHSSMTRRAATWCPRGRQEHGGELRGRAAAPVVVTEDIWVRDVCRNLGVLQGVSGAGRTPRREQFISGSLTKS